MKRSTWIVVVIFLALAGILFYLNQREPAEEAVEFTPPAPIEFLFSDSDGTPTSIDIKNGNSEQVVIVRNEAGVWVLEKQIETEAGQASAEAAATQLTSLRIESRPEVAPEAASLVHPSYILTVETTSGTKKTVRIGDLVPTGIGYYAHINGGDETIIINQTGLDALLTLLESPPYVEPTATNIP